MNANELETRFSHVKPGDTPFVSGGQRDFFTYRDLGIKQATGGAVVAQLVRATKAPVQGTGWHVHEAKFHVVYMLNGWARFMYEDRETLVEAGDCVHQAPGIRHFLFDYSQDMECCRRDGQQCHRETHGGVRSCGLCLAPCQGEEGAQTQHRDA